MASKADTATSKGINYFPGMPKFTAHVRHLGYRNLRLVKREGTLRATDEAAYDVYFGDTELGSFTIRRSGDRIERNIFLTWPNGRMASLGTGGTALDDLLRQAGEWADIVLRTLLFR